MPSGKRKDGLPRTVLSLDERIVIVEAFIRTGRRPYHVREALPLRPQQTIIKCLVDHGLWTRKKKGVWRMDDERTLVEMWNVLGKSAREIGVALGKNEYGVHTYIGANRKRLGLVTRTGPPILDGQIKAIEREFERAIERAMAATGRKRGVVMQKGVRYLLTEAKRRRAKDAIQDLGGMVAVTPPGTKRSRPLPFSPKRKKAA